MSSQKLTSSCIDVKFDKRKIKPLKEFKQIFKALLLMLAVIAGTGCNVLFAKSSNYNEPSAKYIAADNSPKPAPFIFQPIEDSQSEDDEHTSIDNDLYSFTTGTIKSIDFGRSLGFVFEPSISERRLWCRYSNYRL